MKLILFLIFIYSFSFAKTLHTITIDGNLSDWSPDELIYDDSQNDSPWGLQNELHKLYLTWDNTALYIGVSGLQKDGNNLIVYIDTSPLIGISDASMLKEPGNSSKLWWWRRGNKFPVGFLPDFQWHMYQMKLDINEGHGLFKLNTDYTTESMNSVAELQQKSSGDGTAGKYAEAEIKIPWSVFYGGTGIPQSAEISLVVCMTGGMDTRGTDDTSDDQFGSARDTIPDQKAVISSTAPWTDPFTIDTWLTIKIDSDQDSTPDSERSPILRKLSIKEVNNDSVTLSWKKRSVVEKDLSYFNLYYSSSANFVSSMTISNINSSDQKVSYTVTGLQPNTTYFFRITATYNNVGEGGFSETVSAVTYMQKILHTQLKEFFYPYKNILLKFIVENLNISSGVVYYRLKGSAIWHSTTTFITGNELKTEVPAPSGSTENVIEYYFKTEDTTSGRIITLPYNAPTNSYEIIIRQFYSMKVNIAKQNIVSIPDEAGGYTQIVLEPYSITNIDTVYIEPKNIADLYQENQLDGVELPGEPVAVYDIYAEDFAGNKVNFVVSKPAKITLRYFEEDLQGLGQDADSKLGIYYWSGIHWVKIPSEVNISNKTVTGTTMQFSRFAIFYVTDSGVSTSSEELTLKEVIRPSFCPAKNEQVEFLLNKAVSTTEKFKLFVFDLYGRRIVELENSLPDRISWYGRDASGDVVESGVYIYQLKLPNKKISGSCVVIK